MNVDRMLLVVEKVMMMKGLTGGYEWGILIVTVVTMRIMMARMGGCFSYWGRLGEDGRGNNDDAEESGVIVFE